MPMPMAQTARTMKLVAPTQCPAALEKGTVIMMLIVQGLLSVVSTTVCGAWIQEALRMTAVKNQVCGLQDSRVQASFEQCYRETDITNTKNFCFRNFNYKHYNNYKYKFGW